VTVGVDTLLVGYVTSTAIFITGGWALGTLIAGTNLIPPVAAGATGVAVLLAALNLGFLAYTN